MKRAVRQGDAARTVNPYDVKVTDSWWTRHAQPDQRSTFIDAAKVRTIERDHQVNTIEAKRAKRFTKGF